MSIIDETKAAVAIYLAKPAPTLAELMAIVDVVDDAHAKILEAMGEAIHSAQVGADECDEREKSHREALASVQEQIDVEVRRTERAYKARKELAAAVPSATTKELQGREPSNRKKRNKEHLAQGGIHDVAPESAVIGSGA
ncbi:uncharacterized protein EV420DRAFT_1642994 [Desarmillaria tabescens]|uniref:Uncharacterized protein n=1 Tax=Armillaria tabescens TaxID=1929756 RepID=A0AA39KCK8_ARMTA|nr:uncharacterized protein EV420DRAFT_1642994 [Desarmillaria tabescens]KAK0458650.1 hypothetical protein EV420DRAFT_1642994 [Desarmillaria tabescens]